MLAEDWDSICRIEDQPATRASEPAPAPVSFVAWLWSWTRADADRTAVLERRKLQRFQDWVFEAGGTQTANQATHRMTAPRRQSMIRMRLDGVTGDLGRSVRIRAIPGLAARLAR
jgi:hypothetical protein